MSKVESVESHFRIFTYVYARSRHIWWGSDVIIVWHEFWPYVTHRLPQPGYWTPVQRTQWRCKKWDRLVKMDMEACWSMFSKVRRRTKVAPDFPEQVKVYSCKSNIFPCENEQTPVSEMTESLEDLVLEDIEDTDQFLESSVPQEATLDIAEDIVAFVTVVVMELLTQCRIHKVWANYDFSLYIDELADQVLKGVTISEGFIPDDQGISDICKAVMKALSKKFGSKRKLESAILSRQQSVNETIIHCLQVYIQDYSAWSARQKNRPKWEDRLFCVMKALNTDPFWSLFMRAVTNILWMSVLMQMVTLGVNIRLHRGLMPASAPTRPKTSTELSFLGFLPHIQYDNKR